jgi:nucleotide-binding universal stress UspA family protein
MNNILIAVDGSERSLEAAKKVVDLFESKNADITVITILKEVESSVYDVPHGASSTMSADTMQDLRDQRKEEAKETGRKIVDEAASIFESLGKEVNRVIRLGDPADEICDYAEENNIDMIVLADKGHGGVKRFLLGSISDKVVRHADTSVLVVK